jgi:hypothetical protein
MTGGYTQRDHQAHRESWLAAEKLSEAVSSLKFDPKLYTHTHTQDRSVLWAMVTNLLHHAETQEMVNLISMPIS